MKVTRLFVTVAGTAAAALTGRTALADFSGNLPRGVTPMSHQIYDLHMTIFWICVVIGVVVFGIMFYSIFRFRKSAGAKPAQFHENLTIEVIWTIVPFLILVGMAIPATRTLLAIENTSNPALTIQATGSQWHWTYTYIGQGVKYTSDLSTPFAEVFGDQPKDKHYLREVDRPLVLPIHEKVRILTTSTDVIHSWWVPDLGIKRDAIPGFINTSWAWIDKPGVYRGQCAELCGVGHAFMPIVVIAKTQKDFDKWLAEQKAARQKSKTAERKTGQRPPAHLAAQAAPPDSPSAGAKTLAAGSAAPGPGERANPTGNQNQPPLVQAASAQE